MAFLAMAFTAIVLQILFAQTDMSIGLRIATGTVLSFMVYLVVKLFTAKDLR